MTLSTDAPPERTPASEVTRRRPTMAANAAWRFSGIVLRIAAGLLAVPVYTRSLGLSQWGLLALFQAAMSPLALLDLGVGSATVKYVAESVGRGDRAGATRVVHTTLLFNLAMGTAGMLGLVAAAPWLATSLFAIPPGEIDRAVLGFRLAGASWLLGVVAATFMGVLAAHQRYDTTSKLSSASMLLSIGGGIAAAWTTGNVVAVLATQLAISAAMTLVWFRRAARELPAIRSLPRWHARAFRRSFSFGSWQTVAVAGGLLTGYGDRYILGAFFTPAVVGVYATAHLLHSTLYNSFIEVGEVLFPAVSDREGKGDLVGARRLALLVGWTLVTAYGIGGTVLGVVGRDFLHLWISPEAAVTAGPTLRLLCVAGFVGLPAIAPLFYLLGIGSTRWDGLSAPLVGATVVGVGVILAPRLGLQGVAWALLAAVSVRWIVLALIWHHHFRTDFSLGRFAAHLWVPPLVSIATLLALSAAHDALGRAPTWPWFLLETATTLIVSAALQLGAGELLAGGAQRRREVVDSFRPMLDGLLRSIRGA